MERYVQTDAPRLPGSTGGPLVDLAGHLVGIHVFNRRMGAEVAVPADLAFDRAAVLAEHGTIRRPHLGIRSQPVELPPTARAQLGGRQQTGLLIVSIERGSPAERAGLLIGDILVGFDATAIGSHEDLLDAMTAKGASAAAEVEVLRGGARQAVSFTLGAA
jgi:S1-C subfamily serine protease